MVKKSCLSGAVVASAIPLPPAAGATLQWDASSGVCRDVGATPCSGQGPPSVFHAKGPPATAPGVSPYWTTDEIECEPGLSRQALAWEQAAARATFSLAPVLLADTV